MKSKLLYIILFGFVVFVLNSCSEVYDEETVERSRREVTVTVTFDANGGAWDVDGSTTRTISGVKGTKFTNMDTPSKYGYDFSGWSPKFDDVFPQEDTTYHAMWGENVLELTVESLRLGLDVGESHTLKTNVITYTGDEATLSWTSSNENVATVDSNGKIQAKADAELWSTTVITVTSLDGKSASCEVMIVEKEVMFDRIGAYKTLSSSEYTSPNGIAGSYVSFGVFPQSVKSADVEIYGEDWDVLPGGFITMEYGANTYYLGTDKLWYARVDANPYGDYKFSNGETIVPQKRSYFKVEPVIWRVLDSSNGLMLAEKGLVAGLPYYEGFADRTLNGADIHSNNYKYSNIRAYLNGINNQYVTEGGTRTGPDVDWSNRGFLQTAFTTAQRTKVAKTAIDNSFDSNYGSEDTKKSSDKDYSCENTDDYVFLLSKKEWTSSAYGFDGKGETKRQQSDYALASNARSETGGTMFRTRSPEPSRTTDSTRVAALNGGGDWSDNTSYYIASSLVPAICVKK